MRQPRSRQIFAIPLALLIMVGIIFAYNKATDGFSVREISSNLSFDPEREISLPEAPLQAELSELFSQPFRYVGKGCQFYAFESRDQKYILKFFKHKHLRPLEWVNRLPIPSYFQETLHNKIAKREERISKLFSSCKLAYTELSSETGVIFLHLNRTPTVNCIITIYDKLGVKHRVDLNKVEFILQKKVTPAEVTFAELGSTRDKEALRERVRELATAILARCDKGIRDQDSAIVQNLGFNQLENKAVFIDIGQFIKDASIKEEEGKALELKTRLSNLRLWMEERYPDLVEYLEDEIPSRN